MGVPPRGASLVNWDHMTRPLFHSDSLKLIETECEKLEKHTSSREVKLLKPLGMNKKDKKHITPNASGKMKCIQLFRERLSEKMCTRQSRRLYGICSIHCCCRTYFCCFPLALADICPWPLLPFFQISLKKSKLKITHNTFRGCRVHFIR